MTVVHLSQSIFLNIQISTFSMLKLHPVPMACFKNITCSANSGLLRLESDFFSISQFPSPACLRLGSLSKLPVPPNNVLRSSIVSISSLGKLAGLSSTGGGACRSVLFCAWLVSDIFLHCSFSWGSSSMPLPHEMTSTPLWFSGHK